MLNYQRVYIYIWSSLRSSAHWKTLTVPSQIPTFSASIRRIKQTVMIQYSFASVLSRWHKVQHPRNWNHFIPYCCMCINIYHLVMTNSSPWKITMLLIGKPPISMGHLYHGYVSHNQRVDGMKLWTSWSFQSPLTMLSEGNVPWNCPGIIHSECNKLKTRRDGSKVEDTQTTQKLNMPLFGVCVYNMVIQRLLVWHSDKKKHDHFGHCHRNLTYSMGDLQDPTDGGTWVPYFWLYFLGIFPEI